MLETELLTLERIQDFQLSSVIAFFSEKSFKNEFMKVVRAENFVNNTTHN
jgi:hypothetical protein